MKRMVIAGAIACLVAPTAAGAQTKAPPGLGTEEFGLSPRELVQSIERTEELIASCMRDQGFMYVAADYNTVRAGMSADKQVPGLSEAEFIARHGFGVSTFYTGLAPQQATGYNPARVGLGERNIQLYLGLSPAEQAAYNRALLGEATNVTFAVGLEIEDFSRTGGCTRKSISQVFKEDQLKASHYNPQDALINKDPRMKSALSYWAREMRKAGFDMYNHPDDIERDLRKRLNLLTDGGKLLVEKMSPDQQAALKKLQDFERSVAVKSYKLQEEVLVPVEERIQQEMFARKPQ